MKQKCFKCPRMAVWLYHSSTIDGDDAYCEKHVHRGCSCETEEDGGYLLDNKGRPFPCCEYMFDLEGWEVNDE